MPDRINPDNAAGKPAPIVEHTTLSEQERQALEAAGKGYDPAVGALPEEGRPPAPEHSEDATRRAERAGGPDAIKDAEDKGLVAGDTAVPPLDGQRG